MLAVPTAARKGARADTEGNPSLLRTLVNKSQHRIPHARFAVPGRTPRSRADLRAPPWGRRARAPGQRSRTQLPRPPGRGDRHARQPSFAPSELRRAAALRSLGEGGRQPEPAPQNRPRAAGTSCYVASCCAHVPITVQILSHHLRPVSPRVPCVMRRSITTNLLARSARLFVGSTPGRRHERELRLAVVSHTLRQAPRVRRGRHPAGSRTSGPPASPS